MTDSTQGKGEELLPCPFCGNDGLGPIEYALHICFNEAQSLNIDGEMFHNNDGYAVQCDKCSATMGYSETEEGAVEAWNTRSNPSIKEQGQ